MDPQHISAIAQIITVVVLLATLVVVVLYALATWKLQSQTAYQVKFSTLVAVSERLNAPDLYRLRRYVYEEFRKHLAAAATKIEKCYGVTGLLQSGNVNLAVVTCPSVPKGLCLAEFRRRLNNEYPGAYEAVETVLLSMDLLAGPVYNNVGPALQAATMYRAVIRRVAECTLGFIAIQIYLRGGAAREYKGDFLFMLRQLGLLDELAHKYGLASGNQLAKLLQVPKKPASEYRTRWLCGAIRVLDRFNRRLGGAKAGDC